ncbi:terminase small subunit [Microvirga alba]|uniref:Terminase small subunit n=1 Tax=Microvirga alba TaxID=2791025 RepID=A0A931BRG3_9HYPH|nr:terminase small subunit [Microvirga alba]MBF9235571.1 terminase small subunit [Microvirga alba]
MTAAKARGQQVTRSGLADVFGVALPTVDGWVRQGCPFLERGGRGREWKFSTADVMAWLRDKAVAEATGDVQADETELKRRKLAAETAKAELDLAKARGLVAPLDQVERMVSKAFAQVRAGMRNLPGRTVTQLIGETDERKFKTVLLHEIDQVLEALAAANLAEAEEAEDEETEDQE